MLRLLGWSAALALTSWTTAVPVTVAPVEARHGMVVAGHPEAAAAGLEVLRRGGNAIDAAVAVSLALGVAEPHGSGLGGKLVLVYHEADTGKTHAIEALDQAGARLDVAQVRTFTREQRRAGWTSVLVPGLPAGLWLAHQQWGRRPWAESVQPAVRLAREGFLVLPKTHDQFAEQEAKLRSGDPEIAKWYLPGGKLPEPGMRLANTDLAQTLERYAAEGADGFYRGPVAEAIVAGAQGGGGHLTLEDLARYRARMVTPVAGDVFGHRIVGGPVPTTGVALYLTILKALESETWADGPLRSPENLHKVGRVWHVVQPLVSARIADVPGAAAAAARLMGRPSIEEIRQKVALAGKLGYTATPESGEELAALAEPLELDFDEEPLAASTTHFVVVDVQRNVVSCTQSTSLHFGAGVIAPGTGVVMNDTMSNFAVTNPRAVNMVAPGKRARSTTSPTIVLRDGKPVLALGVPGGQRIPIAMLQVLLDTLAFRRPLVEAIGDTRVHLLTPEAQDGPRNVWQVEASLADATERGLLERGWVVERKEPAGRGRHFGGINAVELRADGALVGYPDPRRTNAAAGY